MSSFQDLYVSFTITLRQKPKEVTRSRRRTGFLFVFVLRRLHLTPLGFCLRVIVNETHRNLENTTSSGPICNFNLSMHGTNYKAVLRIRFILMRIRILYTP